MTREIDDMVPRITQAIRNIDQFEYDPQRNASHVSFDPVQVNSAHPFTKKRVIDKLLQLQSLEQDMFAEHSSRYDRDELTIETKKLAEKYFIV